MGYTSVDAVFGDAIYRIAHILSSEEEFERQITLGEVGYKFLPLAKSNIRLQGIEGNFSRLVMRCDRKYSEFEISEGFVFSIPEEWGRCQMQILGAPASKLKLVQH